MAFNGMQQAFYMKIQNEDTYQSQYMSMVGVHQTSRYISLSLQGLASG